MLKLLSYSYNILRKWRQGMFPSEKQTISEQLPSPPEICNQDISDENEMPDSEAVADEEVEDEKIEVEEAEAEEAEAEEAEAEEAEAEYNVTIDSQNEDNSWILPLPLYNEIIPPEYDEGISIQCKENKKANKQHLIEDEHYHEYNDAFCAGYEAGLSDGYNGRTYGWSYDNGKSFFIYSFKGVKDSLCSNLMPEITLVTKLVHRKYVSAIWEHYGETYFSKGFSSLEYYDLEPFDNPRKVERVKTEAETDYEEDDEEEELFDDEFEYIDEFDSLYFEDETDTSEDNSADSITNDDSGDYKECGYDDGYKEGFYYGHQKYLDILNDEI